MADFETDHSHTTFEELDKSAYKVLSELVTYWDGMRTIVPANAHLIDEIVENKDEFTYYENGIDKDVLPHLQKLCEIQRSIVKLSRGSVVAHFQCPSQLALQDLWEMYQDGVLLHEFENLLREPLKQMHNLTSIAFNLTIQETEYRSACQVFTKGDSTARESKETEEIVEYSGRNEGRTLSFHFYIYL